MQYMYRLKDAGSTSKAALPKPIMAARRRRQLYPFFFSMGPVPLSIISVLLIGLMAVLYLSLLGQAVTANAKIQAMHNEQSVLQRQNEDLVNTIAQEQSPAYIATQAKKMGLVPSDPSTVQIIVVRHLQPIARNEQPIQP
jgi:cell division protein FtsB